MDLKLDSREWMGGLAAWAGSAALVYFGTGLHPIWWAAWLIPVPVLIFAARTPRRWHAALAAFGAWMAGGLNLWPYLSGALGVPVIVRLVVLSVPAVLCAVAVSLWRAQIRRGNPWRAALIFPFFSAGAEFLVERVSPHGTFGSIAYTQMDCLPIVQLAALGGTPAIGFFVFLIGALVGILLAGPLLTNGTKARTGGLLAMAAALVFGWGALRLQDHKGPSAELTIGLAASSDPNRIFPGDRARALSLLAEYADVALNLAHAGAQVVVLPEKIAWLDAGDAAQVHVRFRSAAMDGHVTIVVGWARRQDGKVWNEAVLFEPDGSEHAYTKRHLVPGWEAEYVPGDSHLTTRRGNQVWGIAICKDMDFPEISQSYGASGAALMLVPAWDFSVDGWLHSRMAVLRGVEGGFAIARSAKQGLLTVSDAEGRIIAEAPSSTARFATLVCRLSAEARPTLYLRWGGWIGWLCVLGVPAVLISRWPPRE